MIRATLRYTDCLQDGKNVFEVLTRNNIPIIKIKASLSIYPKIIILCKDYTELQAILYALNTSCSYEVRLIHYKNIKGGSHGI